MSTPAAAPRRPSLFRQSAQVGALTFVSRVLGLVRDIVFAVFIGASGGADAFFVAFKIPNFLRRLFAEGAFSQAFVPVLSELRAGGDRERVRHFIDRVAGALGLALILVSAVAMLLAPQLTYLFAPGFATQDPAKFALTADLLRITFPYLALISLAGFGGAILNSYDRFGVPALTPVLLNITLISAALFASDWFVTPAFALAYGVVVAGVLQLAVQMPLLARMQLLPRPRLDLRDPLIRRVLKLMAPAMFGVSVSQINLLLDTVLASLLEDGSVSWLYYSDRLIELPLGVFGIAIATVILPALSRQHASKSTNFTGTLDWALRCLLVISVPASLALLLLAEPIITALFFYGDRFSQVDVEMAGLSLVAYALGLTPFMLIKVLANGYFARQDTRSPVRIGIIAMIANMVLNLVFAGTLLLLGGPGHVGLALATSASAALNAALLYRGLRASAAFQPAPGWGRFGLQVGGAALLMTAVVLATVMIAPPLAALPAWLRVVWLAAFCCGGLLAYGAGLMVLGLRPRHLRPPNSV